MTRRVVASISEYVATYVYVSKNFVVRYFYMEIRTD